jgi:TRAP-type C4-dicarboxylate transport system permease large subunit
MLLRKPLKEGFYVLEAIVANRAQFANRLLTNPISLDGKAAGGVEVHEQRIAAVINKISGGNRFDAEYIAQLRYNKSASDGFDGVCDLATHLFTSHKAIKTEPMNINFIFSGPDQHVAQWAYLYARLPYLLSYL